MYSKGAERYSKGGLKVGRKIGVGKAGVSQNAGDGGEDHRAMQKHSMCYSLLKSEGQPILSLNHII